MNFASLQFSAGDRNKFESLQCQSCVARQSLSNLIEKLIQTPRFFRAFVKLNSYRFSSARQKHNAWTGHKHYILIIIKSQKTL